MHTGELRQRPLHLRFGEHRGEAFGFLGADLGHTHVAGMAFTVEEDEAPDPVDIRFLGAAGLTFEPEQLAYLVEQFGGLGH